jgi:hypothetical protein
VLKVKVLPVQVLNGATTPTSASGYIAEDRISSLGRLAITLKRNILLKVLLEEMVLQDLTQMLDGEVLCSWWILDNFGRKFLER